MPLAPALHLSPAGYGAAEGAGSGASPWGREGGAVGAELTGLGVDRAPLHELTKFLLGYRARVGSWFLSRVYVAPRWAVGKGTENEPPPRARPGCSFLCCSRSLFFFLSSNHVSLSLSLSSFCCMTCAGSRDCTLLVSLTDCPQLARDFFPEPPAGQSPWG